MITSLFGVSFEDLLKQKFHLFSFEGLFLLVLRSEQELIFEFERSVSGYRTYFFADLAELVFLDLCLQSIFEHSLKVLFDHHLSPFTIAVQLIGVEVLIQSEVIFIGLLQE